jgi:hypothetical protein
MEKTISPGEKTSVTIEISSATLQHTPTPSGNTGFRRNNAGILPFSGGPFRIF